MGQGPAFQHKGHSFEIVWSDGLDDVEVGIYVNGNLLRPYGTVPLSVRMELQRKGIDAKQLMIDFAKADVEKDALPEVAALVPK